MGSVEWELGNVMDAAKLLAEALHVGLDSNDFETARVCSDSIKIIDLYLLGQQARAENDYDNSIEHFNQALSLSREADLKSFILKCFRQQGSTYWHMGSFEAYLECNKKGLAIARQINHRIEEGRCLNNIGAFYAKNIDPYRALEYFEEARSLAADQEDQSTLAECLNNMATIYMELGKYDRAEHYSLEAYDLDRSLGDTEAEILDLNNLGNLNLRISQTTGRPENLTISLEYFTQSLSLLQSRGRSKMRAQVLNNIGAVHYLQGELDQAGRFFEEGLNEAKLSAHPEAEHTLLLNMGLVAYQNREIPAAKALLETAARKASQASDLDVLWEVYYGLGICHERAQNRAAALEAFGKSIDAIEAAREQFPRDIYKIGFTKGKIAPFQKIIDTLYSAYIETPTDLVRESIFHYIERGKAQAFLEGVRRDFERIIPEIAAAGSGRPCQLDNTLVGPAAETMRARQIQSISSVQNSLLDERTVLLEYFIGERNSYVFIITKTNSHILRIPDQEKIDRSFKAYLKYISSPPVPLPQENVPSVSFGRELLFPLQTLRKLDIDTVIVIPDGMLNYLPFETLSFSDYPASDLLISRYNVYYGVSASSLCVLKERKGERAHSKALLALAGSRHDPGKEHKRPLPNSKREVQEISKLFSDRSLDIYLDDEAIETILKGSEPTGYQIIHFAGHGLADGKLPFRSALALSRGQKGVEDGVLQMGEVGLLKLNADLVVLSACQTAFGDLERSEGLLSLSRAFFYAGARSVLASLWPVDDSATTELMKRFYAHLLEGKLASQALRLAKLELSGSGYSHPFYWAGFILSGYPDEINWGREKR
jgi:tetratricopeptide (TPR) repeat protein